MKMLDDLHLAQPLHDALQAARDRIAAEFAVDRIVLFRSVVRGQTDEESDVDLLVVLKIRRIGLYQVLTSWYSKYMVIIIRLYQNSLMKGKIE